MAQVVYTDVMKVIPVDVDSDQKTRFWFAAATVAFNSAEHGELALYERLKTMYANRFPDASPADYEAAMARIARMAGV